MIISQIDEDEDEDEDEDYVKGKNIKEISKLVRDIKTHCKPFLNTVPSLIYRGMEGKDDYGIITVRTNRRPEETLSKTHKLFNEIFIDIFGIPLRFTSLFG